MEEKSKKCISDEREKLSTQSQNENLISIQMKALEIFFFDRGSSKSFTDADDKTQAGLIELTQQLLYTILGRYQQLTFRAELLFDSLCGLFRALQT